jgi:hypothetical protein
MIIPLQRCAHQSRVALRMPFAIDRTLRIAPARSRVTPFGPALDPTQGRSRHCNAAKLVTPALLWIRFGTAGPIRDATACTA